MYEFTQPINPGSSVFRGQVVGSQRSVICRKISLRSQMFKRALLHDWYRRIKEIDHPSILPIQQVFEASGYLHIVYSEQATGLNPTNITKLRAVEYAIDLAKGLKILHERNLVHGCLSPDAFTTDHGHASLLDFRVDLRIRNFSARNKQTGGVSRYSFLSPEHFNALSGGAIIDIRSDIYSLGMLLYFWLTGQPLLRAHDLREAIASHCISPNPSLELPSSCGLSHILKRMTAKSRHQRYQTPSDLLADLERARHFLKEDSLIPRSVVTVQTEWAADFDQFIGRERLVESVVERLVARPSVLNVALISGAPGIGKTAFGLRVSRLVGRGGALVLWGVEPFELRLTGAAAFYAAVNKIPDMILRQGPRELKLLQSAILSLEPWADAITTLYPSFIRFFQSKYRKIQNQPAASYFERFSQRGAQRVFITVKLLKAISRVSPVFFWLDDIHRTNREDSHTIFLILKQLNKYPVRILITRRFSTQELDKSLQQLNDIGVKNWHHNLEGLNSAETHELVSQALGSVLREMNDLTEHLRVVTDGNPRKILGALKQLVSNSLLQRSSVGEWVCDLEKIKTTLLKGPVVKSIEGRFQQEADFIFLKFASLSFHYVNVDLLASLNQFQIAELSATIDKYMALGVLKLTNEGLSFCNDSIREDIQKKITVAERAEIYFDLIEGLESYSRELNDHQFNEHCLEFAFYFINFLEESKPVSVERVRLILKVANQLISRYQSRVVIELLELLRGCRFNAEPQRLNVNRILAVALQQEHRIEDSLKVLEEAHHYVETAYQVTQIDRQRIRLLSLEQRYSEAIAIGRCSLELFQLPQFDIDDAQAESVESQLRNIRERLNVAVLLSLGLTDKEEVKAASSIYAELLPVIYTYDYDRFPILVLEFVELILAHGLTIEGPRALTTLGQLLAVRLGDFQIAKKLGDMALQLCKRFDLRGSTPIVLCDLANFLSPWTHSLYDSRALNTTAHELACQTGNWQYAGYSLMHDAFNCFYEGADLTEVVRRSRQHLKRLRGVENKLAEGLIESVLTGSTALQNMFLDPSRGLHKQVSSSAEGMVKAVSSYFIGLRDFIQGRPTAVGVISKAWLYRHTVEGWTAALAIEMLVALVQTRYQDQQIPEFNLTETLERFRRLAEVCPENFKARFLILRACVQKQEGEFWQACQSFEESITVAIEYKQVHLTVLVSCCIEDLLADPAWGQLKLTVSKRKGRMLAIWGVKSQQLGLIEKTQQITGRLSLAQKMTFESLSTSLTTNTTESLKETVAKILSAEGATHCWLGYWQAEKLVTLTFGFQKNESHAIEVSSWRQTQLVPRPEYPETIMNQALNSGEVVVVNDLSKSFSYNSDSVFDSLKIASLAAFGRYGHSQNAVVLVVGNSHALDCFSPSVQKRLHGLVDFFMQLEQLQQSRLDLTTNLESLNTLLKSLKDTVLVVDGFGRLSRDHVLSEPESQLPEAFASQLDKFTTWIQQSKRQGQTVTFEFETVEAVFEKSRLADDTCYFHVQCQPLKLSERDQDCQFLLIIQDVTELRKAYDNNSRIAKSESLSLLAGGVAHDLNNIVTAIQLNIEDLPEDSSSRTSRGGLLFNLTRARALITHLLEFTTESESTALEEIDLYHYLQQFIQHFQSKSLGNKRINLYGDANECFIYAKVVLLDQIFSNLFQNAIEADLENQPIDVHFDSAEDVYRVRIRDYGPGMRPEAVQKAFQPSFSTKDRSENYGLGLTIVERAVNKLKASIAMTTSNSGTEFSIEFQKCRSKRDPRAVLHESEGLKGLRILIIEDEKLILDSLSEILTESSARVFGARTLSEAREILSCQLKIDLLLSDVHLPDGAGPSLMSEAQQDSSNLKFLFMTGLLNQEDFKNVTGEYHVLVKPFQRDQLLAKIVQICFA